MYLSWEYSILVILVLTIAVGLLSLYIRCILVDIPKRKYAEAKLRETNQQLLDIIEILPDATFVINLERKVIAWNRAIEEMTGVRKEKIIGEGDYAYALPFYAKRRPILIDLVLLDDQELEKHLSRYTFVNKIGNTLYAETFVPNLFENRGTYLWGTAAPLYDSSGNLLGAIESIRDISKHKQVEKALRESEDKYRTIFQTTVIAVIIIEEDTTISLVNEEFEKLSGYSKSEIEGKKNWKQVIPLEKLERMIEYHYKRRSDPNAVPTSYETRFIDKQGHIKDVLISVSVIPGTKKSIASFVDISTIKQAEAQLKYLATHDYLTSIPNRYSFEESLKKAVARAKRGKEYALLFIDIDNFKLVNDTKGHAAGDDLLISVANTIKENLRESDSLARLGGDEFGVLLEEATIEEARLAAEKLRKKTEENEFCLLKYGCFNLSLSIGFVMIDGALNSQKLLSLADTALYAAKDKGRNRVVLLDPNEETTTKFAAINQLITQIKNAIKEDKFVLYFQPVVQVASGKIIHHEALIRLKGENGELISPQAFIPAAERFGLMPQIDRWVVGAALDALRQYPDVNLFINISGISLSEESLLEDIEKMITQGGIEPSRIGFEITETAAVKDMLLARRWIERLIKLGCRFALDDFGIGFSSFSYLRMLPVDYLKIDGSFIQNLDKDPSHRALVEAMSTIARSLGKKTVAEYVENGNILKALHEFKIDYAQGYFLGMPAPITELQPVNTKITQ